MNAAEDIKQRLDIVNVISGYVELGKAGRNFRGLCPFHTEKTPSFFVFPERQSWRCFGCNEGGDLITFVMKKEGLEFGEALKSLASRAGVTLPEKKRHAADDERVAGLYRINESAAEYFHQLLLTSPAAKKAREYVEGRRLTPETVGAFRLGFSLDSWDGLKQHLKGQGCRESDLVAAGLSVEKEDRTYDRFRGRLMFPITDPKGRVIGFGARALDDSMPKYLNSAESPVFAKNAVLYGIDRARNAIREQGKVVIVEGYMDALTAHQNGFENVVASMGTALTENQIAMLKGLTKHICLSLDADAAGNAATLRGIEVCRNALAEEVHGPKGWLGASKQIDTQISIISMPEGKDPDEVIREDPDQWRRLVDNAQPLMDYIFAVTADQFDLARPEEKTKLSEQLLPLIAGMRDSAVREIYLARLSRLTELSEKVLVGKLADLTRPAKSARNRVGEEKVVRSALRTGDQLEEYCLCLLLKYPVLADRVNTLSPDHFERSENREIFVLWGQAKEVDIIREKLDTALHEHLESVIERKFPPLDKREQQKAVEDCVRRLDKRLLKSRYVFEAESTLETGENPEEGSERLARLQRQHNNPY